MYGSTVLCQKARKLLDWLAAQPPAVFWAFQQAIRRSDLPEGAVDGLVVSDKEMREMVELVNDIPLSEKLALMSCRSVLKAREELKFYTESRDEVVRAGLAMGKTVPMDKSWSTFCLLYAEEVKKVFDKSSFSGV